MAIPGQRFVVDLDDEQGINVDNAPVAFDPSSVSPFGLIGEIRERSPSAAVPPAPKPPTGSTGFPEHRRRVNQSAFKQRRANKQQAPAGLSSPSTTPSAVSDEKKSIDEENRRQLASMSPGQIEQEKEELIASLDPSLLQRFLRRAQIDDDSNVTPASETTSSLQSHPASSTQEVAPAAAVKPRKSVSFNVAEKPEDASTQTAQQHSPHHRRISNPPVISSTLTPEDLAPAQPPSDLLPASEIPSHDAFHFPTPPQQRIAPNLDPSSPSFLSDLQTHYFPEISHDPSSISWLQPPSADPEDPDSTSAYHPASNAEAIHPSALRFSLLGTILSPSTSLSLPTSLGLHHHGKDPHAAGYTIPELAILSRSSFPAQRCIAWQVLGRILYRLGKGQLGERGTPLVEGLWSVIEHEGVVAGMLAEAEGASAGPSRSSRAVAQPPTSASESESDSVSAVSGATSASVPPPPPSGGIGRHASASAWAVEGVWLWQMGGGGDRGILKENQIRSQ